MRFHVALLITVSAVCPAATQSCSGPDWTSFWEPNPAPSTGTTATVYCEGWNAGWLRGWVDVKGPLAALPAPPSCPAPECGRDTYDDGYAVGRVAGVAAANRPGVP
jgi:hypothetical protein